MRSRCDQPEEPRRSPSAGPSDNPDPGFRRPPSRPVAVAVRRVDRLAAPSQATGSSGFVIAYEPVDLAHGATSCPSAGAHARDTYRRGAGRFTRFTRTSQVTAAKWVNRGEPWGEPRAWRFTRHPRFTPRVESGAAAAIGSRSPGADQPQAGLC
jgi:hypothetical protein